MAQTRWWSALALFGPALALATTLVPHTLAQRARASTRVAVAKVLAQSVAITGDDPKSLRTLTEVLVQEDVVGQGPQRLTVVQLGGAARGWTVNVPGDARFAVGETALLFLSCKTADRCSLVAMDEGRLPVLGDEVVVHDLFTGAYSKKKLAALVKELQAPLRAPAPVAPSKELSR